MKNMNTENRLQGLPAPYQRSFGVWHTFAKALAIGVSAIVLGGCWAVPLNVLTSPGNPVPVGEVFPSALLAEPVQLRAGYTHTTQPFQIKGPKERWFVALGFVRSDEVLSIQQREDGGSDRCWTESLGKGLRPQICRNSTPGFFLRWDLLRADGSTAAKYEFDSLREESGGTYSGNAITRTLSGFSDQGVGSYRLRITVLRDAKELDFLRPHILVNKPFFSSRSIE